MTAEPIAAANTHEWHAARQRGIGASESAAACGLSRWELPLEVWSRKVHGHQKDETDAMLLGTLMEPVVAEMFRRKTGREIVQASPGLFRHAEVPWLLASPDALLSDDTVAEFKTTTSRNGDMGAEGTDEVPVEWLCQAQQQIAVTGASAVRFGVLIDGREFREYVVERHSVMIDRMIAREAELWQHVESRTPPPIDFSHTRAADAVRNAYREVVDGVTVELDAELEAAWELYEEFGKKARELEKDRDRIKAEVLARIADAQCGVFPSGAKLTRKIVAGGTVPAYERKPYVRLSHKKG